MSTSHNDALRAVNSPAFAADDRFEAYLDQADGAQALIKLAREKMWGFEFTEEDGHAVMVLLGHAADRLRAAEGEVQQLYAIAATGVAA